MNKNKINTIVVVLFLTVLSLSIGKIKLSNAQVETPLVFTAAGDYSFSSSASSVLQFIPTLGPSFHIALGDFSYSNTRPESDWCQFVRDRIGPSLPFQLVSGDHENDLVTGDGFIDNFVACLPDMMNSVVSPFGKFGREYYFDQPNLRVIVANADVEDGSDLYSYSVGSDHYNWLQGVIRQAKSEGKWVIVANHKTCLTIGVKSCSVGTDFTNLLISEGVDLVLEGNDHNYQRSKQLTCLTPNTFNANCTSSFEARGNTYVSGNGTTFMVVGTGGSDPLYNLNVNDSEFPYFASYMGGNINPTFGVAKISLTSTQMDVYFVPAIGSFTDSFSIVKSQIQPTPTPLLTTQDALLVADASVKQLSPTTNYGTSNMIEVDGSPFEESLIKFDVGDISSKNVVSAKLRLYNVNSSNMGGDIYKASSNNWTETTVNWNNAPLETGLLLSSIGAVNPDNWYEADVKSAITQSGEITFRVKLTSSDGADYSSKEDTLGNKPRLILTLQDTSANPVTPTPTVIPTTTPTVTPSATSLPPTPTPTVAPTPTPTIVPTPTPTPVTEIVVSVLHDTKIQSSTPTKNFGTLTTFTVDSSPVTHSLLKFNVTGINGRVVKTAKLRVYNSDSSSKGGDFYKTTSSWNETTVNWNTAPQAGALVGSLAKVVGTSTLHKYYDLDVKSYITADGLYSFRVSSTSSDGATFISKEGGISESPKLIITTY